MQTFVDEVREPGFYTVAWDGKDSYGNDVASGVFFCRMRAGHFAKTRKMIILK